MSAEDDEWRRAAQMGAYRRKRALVRTAGVVAGALVLAAGVLAAMYWDQIGSKKKAGDHCLATTECGADLHCFESKCTLDCESDARCPAGLSCVRIPVVVETVGQPDRDGGFLALCVADEDAPRYMEAYRNAFQNPLGNRPPPRPSLTGR